MSVDGLSVPGLLPCAVEDVVPKPTFSPSDPETYEFPNVSPTPTDENQVSASSNRASVPLVLVNLDLIAKINPVGPVIG